MFVLYSNVPQPNDSKPVFFKSHSDLQEFLSTLHKDFPVKVVAVTGFDAYYEGHAGDCIQHIDNEVDAFMHEFHEGQPEEKVICEHYQVDPDKEAEHCECADCIYFTTNHGCTANYVGD